MNKLTNKEAILKSKEIWKDFYDYSLFNYKNARTPIKLICPVHGEFEQKFHVHLRAGCYQCGCEKRRNKKEKLINIFNKIHNFKYDYSKMEYCRVRDKIIVICPNHGEFEINPGNHKHGNGCLKCSIENQAYSKEEFIKLANEKHNFKYDYSKVEYKNNHTKIMIICPDHGEFNQMPQYHLSGNGCQKCWLNKEIENREIYKKEWIEKCNQYHNFKYNYSLSNYFNSRKKLTIICPSHGQFKQEPRMHTNHGCPKCCESNGEKKIASILDSLRIKYIREFKFKECRDKLPLSFDFYLSELNTCIEFNGLQHYEMVKYFGGEERFKDQQVKDQIKRNFCMANGINLIEIKYYESVEEKLNIFK